jgi:hypothetical protein
VLPPMDLLHDLLHAVLCVCCMLHVLHMLRVEPGPLSAAVRSGTDCAAPRGIPNAHTVSPRFAARSGALVPPIDRLTVCDRQISVRQGDCVRRSAFCAGTDGLGSPLQPHCSCHAARGRVQRRPHRCARADDAGLSHARKACRSVCVLRRSACEHWCAAAQPHERESCAAGGTSAVLRTTNVCRIDEGLKSLRGRRSVPATALCALANKASPRMGRAHRRRDARMRTRHGTHTQDRTKGHR